MAFIDLTFGVPRAERSELDAYSAADLTAVRTVAAELGRWLGERELDLEETSLCDYRDIFRCYVTPHIGVRQVYSLDKHVLHDLYKTLLKQGIKNGGPLSATRVRTVYKVLTKHSGRRASGTASPARQL